MHTHQKWTTGSYNGHSRVFNFQPSNSVKKASKNCQIWKAVHTAPNNKRVVAQKWMRVGEGLLMFLFKERTYFEVSYYCNIINFQGCSAPSHWVCTRILSQLAMKWEPTTKIRQVLSFVVIIPQKSTGKMKFKRKLVLYSSNGRKNLDTRPKS